MIELFNDIVFFFFFFFVSQDVFEMRFAKMPDEPVEVAGAGGVGGAGVVSKVLWAVRAVAATPPLTAPTPRRRGPPGSPSCRNRWVRNRWVSKQGPSTLNLSRLRDVVSGLLMCQRFWLSFSHHTPHMTASINVHALKDLEELPLK